MVLPLVILAALSLVQVTLLARDALVVVQAAREGAREAAVTTDATRIRSAALRAGSLPADRAVVVIDREGGAGDPVTVTVRFRTPLVVPFIEWLFPEDVTVHGTATMRQEVGEQ